MITDQFVTYEVAKLAKEKGFDEPTLCAYDEEGKTLARMRYCVKRNSRTEGLMTLAAPTQGLLQRWLREEKGLHINIDYNHPNKSWTPTIIRMCCIPTRNTPYRLDLPSSSSYEVAFEKALIYALNMLPSRETS